MIDECYTSKLHCLSDTKIKIVLRFYSIFYGLIFETDIVCVLDFCLILYLIIRVNIRQFCENYYEYR